MEADLARFYNVDYRDRWRIGEHGRPRLTLRRLNALVRHLPMDAALVRVENDGAQPWSRVEHLLDELRRHLAALGGDKKPKADPGRKVGQVTRSPEFEKKRAAARARERVRQQRLATRAAANAEADRASGLMTTDERRDALDDLGGD